MWGKKKEEEVDPRKVPRIRNKYPQPPTETNEDKEPDFYPIHQKTWSKGHPIPTVRKTKPSALKQPISEEVKDVPQYHNPDIYQPWFRKIIRDCQPHVHNYRMCLVDEISREYFTEDIAREQGCNVLGWNLINCSARAICGEEMQNTGWDCYNNDPLYPSKKCEESQGKLNTCMSLHKILHIPNMIPAHITPDSYLWKDFDKRWDWLRETGWGDWKNIIEKANRENPPYQIREYFRRLQLDRERRLVWLNKRRTKYGEQPFTMDDLIEHEKELDVYESMDEVPQDLLQPTIYP